MTWPIVALSIALSIAGATAAPGDPSAENPPGQKASAAAGTDLKVHEEFKALQAQDDAAQTDVQKLKHENSDLKAAGKGQSDAELKQRIHARLEPVRNAYDAFLRKHPEHAEAHLLYGNFLSEIEEEKNAKTHWEKAIELDPKLPEPYDNLAALATETGDTRKAFEYFSKAIELSPSNASFYHSFGDGVYVLRRGMVKEFALTEQQVFAKALQLYSNAVRLEPTNFLFMSDMAQTYYALQPIPYEQALPAWTNASRIAPDETRRGLALIHLARLKMLQGQLDEARAQLAGVTNQECSELKSNLLLRIQERATERGAQ